MARPSENTERVNIFLPKDLHDDVKKEAQEKGINVSALVRMILLERRYKK